MVSSTGKSSKGLLLAFSGHKQNIIIYSNPPLLRSVPQTQGGGVSLSVAKEFGGSAIDSVVRNKRPVGAKDVTTPPAVNF